MSALVTDHQSKDPTNPNNLIRITRGQANLGELTDFEMRPTYELIYPTASGEAKWLIPIHEPTIPKDEQILSGLTPEALAAVIIDHLRMGKFFESSIGIKLAQELIDWLIIIKKVGNDDYGKVDDVSTRDNPKAIA